MSTTRPNVVFIVADQHNAKVLGHAGHPDVKTPHLDRLAGEGVRFDTAICQNPICTPSRVSFLSGQYCHNHGYYGLSGPNPRGLPNILGHFREHGYTTAALGKIHCPEYWIEDQADEFHETCNCSIGGRSPQYTAFLQERGMDEHEDHLVMRDLGPRGGQSMEGRVSRLSFEQSQEGWIAARSVQFMGAAAERGQPFFAHVSFPRPHQCTAPSEPFWAMYQDRDLWLPPNADYDMESAGKAPHLRATAANWRKAGWALLEPKTFEAARRRKLHGYLGAVSQVDHAVGQILEFLASSGLDRNTVVVYTSDHGDYACEHGIMEKAPGICSDAITRVPLIIRVGGSDIRGHRVAEPVELVDLAPTFCALADLPLLETTDGRDLSGQLRGDAGDGDRPGVTEGVWSKSIRQGNWRLVRYPADVFAGEHPGGFGELYDLASDPWEKRNLYFDPVSQPLVRRLESRLMDWLIQTTRPRTVLADMPNVGPQFIHRYKHTVLQDGKIGRRQIDPVLGRMGNYI